MSSVDTLVAVVPPPVAPLHARGDWAAVEAAMGTALPADFKALTERYGAGSFVDELHPLTPFLDDCAMARRAEALMAVERQAPAGERQVWFPAAGGLLIWGTSSNSHRLCWRTDGPPDSWGATVVDGRGGAREDHDLDASGLLLAYATDALPASMLGRPRGAAEGDPPWFEPAHERVHVTVQLGPATGDPAARLAAVLAALATDGPLSPRGRWRGTGGAAQDHVATATGWRVTYDTAYGHNLRIAYPAADEPAVRAMIDRVVAALN